MRIGLVGCGKWGRLILRDLVAIGCEVPVVARSVESRQRALDGGASEIVGDVASLAGVSGVVVATSTSTHGSVIGETLDLGVPVFTEKPLTDDPQVADDLVARAGDRLFVMDKWRYHRGVEALGAMTRSGEFGALRILRTGRLAWGQSHDDVDAVWVLAPHDLAIVLEIAGRIPDVIAAVGSSRGTDASLTALLGPDPMCILAVSSLHPVRERSVLLEFDEAILHLDGAYADGIAVIRPGTSGEPEFRAIADDMPLLRELEAFVEHLRGGPPPRSTGSEGALMVRRIAELRALAGI